MILSHGERGTERLANQPRPHERLKCFQSTTSLLPSQHLPSLCRRVLLTGHSHTPSLPFSFPYGRNNRPLPDYSPHDSRSPPPFPQPTMSQKSQLKSRLLYSPPQSWPLFPHNTLFKILGCKLICLPSENHHVMLTPITFLPDYTPPCGTFYGKKTVWNFKSINLSWIGSCLKSHTRIIYFCSYLNNGMSDNDWVLYLGLRFLEGDSTYSGCWA